MSDLRGSKVQHLDIDAEGDVILPPSWQGLRQQIVYLAQFGNSIQVIHAELGGGKTTFFNHLQAAGLGSTTIGVTVTAGAGLMAFLGDVLREAGLRPDARATLGELAASLRGYVQTLHRERLRAVLLVDDAHHLADSELGALVSTLQGQADQGVGLHVVLFSEPGLAARIDALQVLDVAVHDAPLPVFSPAEVQQLLQAHPAGAEALDAEQTQRIWYQSRGLPGKALEIVERSRPSPPLVTENAMSLRGLPIGHIAALVVLCGVLVWAFLVRKSSDTHQDASVGTPVEVKAPTAAPFDPEPPAPTNISTDEIEPEISTPAKEPTSPTIEVTHVTTVSPTDVAPETPQNEAGANLEQDLGQQELDQDELGRIGKAESAKEEKDLASQGGAEPPAKSDSGAKSPIPDAPKTLSEDGEKRLLSYPDDAYVLQLMAASAEESLAAYVAEQPNRGNLSVYKTERGGKVLFILIEGFYADKTSAQAAIVNLPSQQRKGGPWPKKVGQIKEEIRKKR